ncbi:MAG: TlpA disulfide reductase family protein [Candidatus Omnitrophota bacterium]
MVRQKKSLFLFVLLGLSLLSSACSSASVESMSGESSKANVASDFTLKGVAGEQVSLSSFKGKNIVLLDFGATWCPHCVTAIPRIKGIYEKYKKKGLEVIYIDIRESQEKVKALIEKFDIPYTVLIDEDGKVAKEYEIRGIPTMLLIDKDGSVIYRGHYIEEKIVKDAL